MARGVKGVMREVAPFPTLTTKRLRLRAVKLADVEAMHACFGDPEAMKYWNRPAHARVAETDRVVRRGTVFAPFKKLMWAVDETATGQCIGMVNYHNVDMHHRHADVGYLLRRDRWGQGLGREAMEAVVGHCFRGLKLNRLQAVIDPDNAASRKLVEALGFTLEGVLRETLFLGGAWRDDCVYGLLAREWAART